MRCSRAISLASALLLAAVPAYAQHRGPYGYGGGHYTPHYHGYHEHWHGPGPGALLGLGAAAVIGGALAAPYVYAPPPPVYVAPPVYAPPPPVCWTDYYGRTFCRPY